MANEVRKITLTQLGSNAGPNFSVQYSTDCINYTQSIDCTNAFLPNVGSFVYCTVDADTTCVRLTSLTAVCGNSVVENLTLTTTTTVSPTTSTTTTTQSPTTSTTLSPTTSTTTLTPTTTAACYTCDDGYVYYETSSNDYGTYPDRFVCFNSDQCGLLAYDAIDRPNRFSLYDSTGLVATTGWVGYATWSGPWGASLNVTPSGNLPYQWNSTSLRYIRVEYGNGDPINPTSDAANLSLLCGTCPTTTTTTLSPTTSTTTLASIYTHGQVRGTCSDYCNTNYLIQTLTTADAPYGTLTIGDTIYGQGGSAGYVAYSNTSTDTNTGPFRIAEIDSNGVILSILVCIGGTCVPL